MQTQTTESPTDETVVILQLTPKIATTDSASLLDNSATAVNDPNSLDVVAAPSPYITYMDQPYPNFMVVEHSINHLWGFNDIVKSIDTYFKFLPTLHNFNVDILLDDLFGKFYHNHDFNYCRDELSTILIKFYNLDITFISDDFYNFNTLKDYDFKSCNAPAVNNAKLSRRIFLSFNINLSVTELVLRETYSMEITILGMLMLVNLLTIGAILYLVRKMSLPLLRISLILLITHSIVTFGNPLLLRRSIEH